MFGWQTKTYLLTKTPLFTAAVATHISSNPELGAWITNGQVEEQGWKQLAVREADLSTAEHTNTYYNISLLQYSRACLGTQQQSPCPELPKGSAAIGCSHQKASHETWPHLRLQHMESTKLCVLGEVAEEIRNNWAFFHLSVSSKAWKKLSYNK